MIGSYTEPKNGGGKKAEPKKADIKTAEPKKADAKKTEKAESKAKDTAKANSTATAKNTSKAKSTAKTGTKQPKAAKKPEAVAHIPNIELQYLGKAIPYSEIVERARKESGAKGELNIYIKPEEDRVYYVAGDSVGALKFNNWYSLIWGIAPGNFIAGGYIFCRIYAKNDRIRKSTAITEGSSV